MGDSHQKPPPAFGSLGLSPYPVCLNSKGNFH
nr:MAG TPA: hypothetical protein [Crassvirales sp.]